MSKASILKLKTVFIYTALSMLAIDTSVIYASGKEGHGGTALFCEPNGKLPARFELLDIYEAENELSLKLIAVNGSKPIDLITQAMKKFEAVPKAHEGIQRAYKLLQTQVSPWIEGDRSMVTTDYISIFPNERCRRVQIGRRDFATVPNEQGVLKVNFSEFERLSPISKAAFWIHEAVYEWMFHEFGTSISDIPRIVTGLAFAEGARDEEIVEALTNPKIREIKSARFRMAALKEMLALDMNAVNTSDPSWGLPEELDLAPRATQVTLQFSLSVTGHKDIASVCAGILVHLLDEEGKWVESIIGSDHKSIVQCFGGERSGEVVFSAPARLLRKTIVVVFERAALHAQRTPVNLRIQMIQTLVQEGDQNVNDETLLNSEKTILSGSSELRRTVQSFKFRPSAY